MHVVGERFAHRREGADQVGGRVRIIRLKWHHTETERREAERI